MNPNAIFCSPPMLSVVQKQASGAALPVFDSAVVGSEAMIHPPEHGLGTAAHVDLAVDRAYVGLDCVGAEGRELGDLRVALALRDQREDLGFSFAESLGPARPVQSDGATHPQGAVADDRLPGVYRLQCG